MLQFFRKHQKILFIFTSVIIITSFVFFGTYQAFVPNAETKEVTLYKTEDGRKVGRNYMANFCHFLNYEGFFSQGNGNFNFLNDGVISKDFLDSGLGIHLFEQFPEVLCVSLENRLDKEKGFVPYKHPTAPFVSADLAWATFAPDLRENLTALQNVEDPQESVEPRIELFLSQMRFPPTFMAQVLGYQAKERPGLRIDPRNDYSLFRYKNISDWFGKGFVDAVAQTIIHGAQMAKQQGHRVSKEEVKLAITQQTSRTFEAVGSQLGYRSAQDLYERTLAYMGIDESTLYKITQDIMLFRRLFQGVSNGVFLDATTLQDFYGYANSYATIEVTQLPQAMRLQSKEDLEAFESYLACVADISETSLPQDHLPLNEIPKELVGKRIDISYKGFDPKALHARVSVSETWSWEKENLSVLKQEFPELAFKSIDDLSAKKRREVDNFANEQIIQAHPEWVEESFAAIEPQEKTLFVSVSQQSAPLPGCNPDELLIALEKEEEATFEGSDRLYRIAVKERREDQLLTFEQARKEGVVAKLPQRSAHLPLATRFNAAFESEQEGTLACQWKPQTSYETVSRAHGSFLTFEEVCAQEGKEFSDLRFSEERGPYRFRFVEKKSDTTLPLEKMLGAREMLASELREQSFVELLSMMDLHDAS